MFLLSPSREFGYGFLFWVNEQVKLLEKVIDGLPRIADEEYDPFRPLDLT